MSKIANQLTNRQILYRASLLITLFLALFRAVYLDGWGHNDHGYTFTDSRVQALLLWFESLLPTALLFLVTLAQKSKWKTISLVILIPINVASLLALGFYATIGYGFFDLFVVKDRDHVTFVNDVAVHLLRSPETTDNRYGPYTAGSILRLERSVLGGLVSEYKTLITVYPTREAHYKIIESGKKIRFIDSADLNIGRTKPVVRIFNADWYSNVNRLHEQVED